MAEDVNLRAFFRAVREAARKHGLKAHIVCAVEADGGQSQVRIASDAVHTFTGKDEKFLKRCYDAMEESLDLTLGQLEANDAEVELLN